jgi:hypothetical protein
MNNFKVSTHLPMLIIKSFIKNGCINEKIFVESFNFVNEKFLEKAKQEVNFKKLKILFT